jgi:long-chain acyl-CoA synthetase
MNTLRTVCTVIDELARYGDRPAVLAFHKKDIERWSYAELAEHAERMAFGLAAAGVGKETYVGFLAQARPEWLAAAMAVIKAGAVVVSIDMQLTDEVLAHVLQDSGCRFLVTASDQTERLKGRARVAVTSLSGEAAVDQQAVAGHERRLGG